MGAKRPALSGRKRLCRFGPIFAIAHIQSDSSQPVEFMVAKSPSAIVNLPRGSTKLSRIERWLHRSDLKRCFQAAALRTYGPE